VINETLEAYGVPLSQNQQVSMAQLLALLLQEMLERRQAYAEMKKDPDYDATMQMEYAELVDMEDKFLQEIVLCNKRIAQLCKGVYVEVFHQILFEHMRNLLQRSVGEICWSLACFDDMIECAKPQSVSKYADFLQKTMLHFKDNKDEWITQNVAYAVHVLSQAKALQNAMQWAQWLTEQISNPAGRSASSIENCTSALGVMLLSHGDQLNAKEVLPFWLSHLPIREDEEEVETSTKTIVQLAKLHPSIIQEHRPKVQAILLSGLGGGCLADATAQVAVEMLGSITSDPSQLEGMIRQMEPHEATTVLTLLGAAQGAGPSQI